MEECFPRLIAVDLDGTLLNSRRDVTPGVCEAIQMARKHGVRVVPCSGRHFAGTRAIARQAGMGDIIVSGNGAQVSAWDGSVIARTMLNPVRCPELLRLCREYRLGCNLYAGDVLYTQAANRVTRYYEQLNAGLPEGERCVCQIVPDLNRIVCEQGEQILKLEIFPLPDEARLALTEQLKLWGDVAAEGNLRTSVELHAAGVSKATGLAAAARFYGIAMSGALAIGDAENDVSMLKQAGFGAAMGNGVEAAKLAADEVIPTNDEDGVAFIIRRFLG